MNLRLQGGPFCGHRTRTLAIVPRVVYVVGRFLNGVATGGSEWFPYAVDGCELYRHDSEKGGWHVFVWTDVMLDINLAEMEEAAEYAKAAGFGP